MPQGFKMINYKILTESLDFYEKQNFQRVETPWIVSDSVSNITKPVGGKDFSITEKNKVLVASGEQGFLYQYLKGFLPHGTYQTLTPCFRDEKFDEWHHKYFMKNELIKTDSTTKTDLKSMIDLSMLFFKQYLPEKLISIKEYDSETFDIECAGIELGSYGIRSCSFLKWVYGTGCAEPRLSTVVNWVKVNGL
jgi:aspartyl/asparaginyl-tRNA synthetase